MSQQKKKRAERRSALPYMDAQGIVHIGDTQLAVCGLSLARLTELLGEPDDGDADGSGFAFLRWGLPSGDLLSVRLRGEASDFVSVHFHRPVRKRTLLALSGVTDLQRAPGHSGMTWENPAHGVMVGLDSAPHWVAFIGFSVPWDPRKLPRCAGCGHAHHESADHPEEESS